MDVGRNQDIHLVVGEIPLFLSGINESLNVVKCQAESFLRFGLNSLLWWLVVALTLVLLLAASFFTFFLHLSEFLLLVRRKDGLNLRSRSLVDLLHLFSFLILSQ